MCRVAEILEEAHGVEEKFQTYFQFDTAILEFGRASSPASCYRNAKKWAAKCGVVRVADATGLDRLGLPNYLAVRPDARHPSVVVSAGKGVTAGAAINSALFEAFERWAAETTASTVFFGTCDELLKLDSEVALVKPQELPSDWRVGWVLGFELVTRRPCLVPVQCVIFPFVESCGYIDAVSSDTNGLTSGSHPLEAICAGIFELIERDAIRRIEPQNLRRIDRRYLSSVALDILNRFSMHCVDVSLVSCPSPTNIPVVYGISRDHRFELPSFLCSGSGAHVDSNISILRALTEISQSRVAFIATLREDVSARVSSHFSKKSFEEWLDHYTGWFEEGSFQFRDEHLYPKSFLTLLSTLIDRISQAFPKAQLACVPLYEASGLFAFRTLCPSMHGLTRS